MPATPKRKVRSKKGVPTRRVRSFKVGAGLPSPAEIRDELTDMRDVLLGRVDPPEAVARSVLALQEVADMFFGRACEMEQLILKAEAEGAIPKNSKYHSLRTQEIRSFKEQSKSAAELGSRRLSAEQLLFDQERTGRETG